jgi:thiol-disulfide isomerase/thioredoxin
MTLDVRPPAREPLDPWDDAAWIAGKLGSPFNRLIVVIGAESWCEKCRALKPHFEQLARQSPDRDILLWLDLEEHQEFLGAYIPVSLPEVLIYKEMKLIARSLLSDGSEATLRTVLQTLPAGNATAEDPDLARRLARQDWA